MNSNQFVEIPKLLRGDIYDDFRGKIFHNNQFDFSPIKRSYIIENIDINYLRGWKGHKIENRWFICVKGRISIKSSSITMLENKESCFKEFILDEGNFDILYVPKGFATLIQQKKPKSKIMVFSDYKLGVSNDENWRWPNDIIDL